MSGPTNPAGLSFTAPTTYTDGTAIPAGDIASYDYGYGTATGNYSTVVNDATMKTAGGKIASLIPTNLAEGQWFASARSRTKEGVVSAWGNEIQFVVAKQPSAIADFSAA